MKIFILFFLLFLSATVFGATCTTTSRNNYVTNQVLTSSGLNTDFNQLVTKVNAFDGGCVTTGTLEYDALNTTQFAPLLKGVKEGCKVSYSNASTLSVGKCLAAVNGNFVYTTGATTVSFGCTSCSSETTSTTYYVYIATGSSATTLNLLILTTAPNEDGYDNSGNRVLAKVFNNASSDLDSNKIRQWVGNSFLRGETVYSAKVSAAGAVSDENANWIVGNCTDATPFVCTYDTSVFLVAPNCVLTLDTSSDNRGSLASGAPTLSLYTRNSGGSLAKVAAMVSCQMKGTDYTWMTD